MVRRESIIEKEHVQGGKGTVYLHRVLLPEELNGHGRAYMRVVLPPGTSIGWHQHQAPDHQQIDRTGGHQHRIQGAYQI